MRVCRCVGERVARRGRVLARNRCWHSAAPPLRRSPLWQSVTHGRCVPTCSHGRRPALGRSGHLQRGQPPPLSNPWHNDLGGVRFGAGLAVSRGTEAAWHGGGWSRSGASQAGRSGRSSKRWRPSSAGSSRCPSRRPPTRTRTRTRRWPWWWTMGSHRRRASSRSRRFCSLQSTRRRRRRRLRRLGSSASRLSICTAR